MCERGGRLRGKEEERKRKDGVVEIKKSGRGNLKENGVLFFQPKKD